ncbi:MAG: C1 family peptidase [Bacteroidales bacterium]|nr:C1 family peptidase [Bacteroidales bacterium]
MKKILTLLSILGLSLMVSAQTISKSELAEIQGSFVKDASTIALQNILTNDKNIKTKALNHAKVTNPVDHYFKYRVDIKGITDQKSSGRCWMFTSMNVFRPDVINQLNVPAFDFSHNFCYFWDMFEKSNLFLENVIATADRDMQDRDVEFFFKSPIGDGGVWNLFYNIAEKYGVVPKQVMPETEHSNNTGQMSSMLRERLRVGGYQLREMYAAGSKIEALRAEKINILKDVYRVLALCLGEPPTEFSWRYKDNNGQIQVLTSTPLEFYKSIVPENYNPETYVMIMNDPTREYYKVYDISNYRNTYEGLNWVYLNLPNEDIKAAALASLKNNEPMYASCDVGKQYNSETGILDVGTYDYESLFGINLKMDKKARILTRQSGSAHAMSIVGCDTDANDVPIKWEFENSWGPASGNKGFLTFTDKWFDEYLFRIVINRRYLDAKAIKALDSKPILLPPWDYMF